MKIKRKLIGGLAAAVIGFGSLTSCGALNNPTANRNINNLGQIFGGSFVESVGSELGHKAMNPGESSNGNEGISNSRDNSQQKFKPELLIYNKWVDLDGDGYCQYDEYFGLGKKVFNLNKENLEVCFWNRDYLGPIILRSWNSNGKVIGETKYTFKKMYDKFVRFTGPTSKDTSHDFADQIKEAGPGEYKITATLNDGRTFVKDITIVRDKKN